MEDIDGGLHPAVDGQSLDEDEAHIDSTVLLSVKLPSDTTSAIG